MIWYWFILVAVVFYNIGKWHGKTVANSKWQRLIAKGIIPQPGQKWQLVDDETWLRNFIAKGGEIRRI